MKRFTTQRLAYLCALLAAFVDARSAGANAAQFSERFAQRNPPARAAAPRRFYVYQHLSVAEADLARLAQRLSRFGIRLPFDISGTISARVRVGVPLRTLFDRTDYRLTGSAESRGLKIAGVRLEDLSARVAYDEGVLQLEELAFRLPAAGGLKSHFSGAATAQIFPRGDLTASFTMDQIGLDAVRKLAPELPPGAADLKGSVSGRVNARVPLDRLRDPAAWRARGNVSLGEVQAFGLPPARAETEYQLQQGRLTLIRLGGTFLGARLSGSADVQLVRPFNYNALLAVSQGNLARLAELPPGLRPPLALEGRYALSARVNGSLRPGSTSAAGGISVRGVNVKGARIDTLRFNYAADGQSLAISGAVAELYGGRASGSASAQIARDLAPRASIRWEGVDLGRLASDVLQPPFPVTGRAGGALDLRHTGGALDDLTTWQASGNVRAAQLEAYGFSADSIRADLDLRLGQLRLANLAGVVEGAVLSGTAEARVVTPYPVDAAIRLDRGDLSRLRSLPFAVAAPPDLAGRYALSARLQGTLSPLKVRAAGGLNARDLAAFGLRVDSVGLAYALSEQRVALTNISTSLYGGRLRGAATVPLGDQVAGHADLTWQTIDAGRMATGYLKLPAPFSASTSGSVRLDIPAAKTKDFAAWSGSGQAEVSRVAGYGLTGATVRIGFTIDRGLLKLPELLATLGRTRIAGSGQLAAKAPCAFSSELRVTDADLSLVNQLPANLRPPVEIAGLAALSLKASGGLQPFRYTASGSGSVQPLKVAGAELESASFEFSADPERLALDRFQTTLYGGQVSGSAVVPLADTVGASLNAAWKNLNIGQLANDLVKLPVKLSASVNGSLAASAPAGHLNDFEAWNVRADFDAPDLRANAVHVGNLSGKLTAKREILSYQVQGRLLQGTVELRGAWHEDRPQAAGEEGSGGRFDISGLRLGELGRVFPQSHALGALAGEVSLGFKFQQPGKLTQPEGTGAIDVADLRFGRTTLADRLHGLLRLTPGRLQVIDFTGALAGGTLRGGATVGLQNPVRGDFSLDLSGARTTALLAAWPEAAGWVSGLVDVQLRGVLGRTVRAMGAVGLRDGKLAGVSMSGVRAPVVAELDPLSGTGRIDLQDFSSSLAQGRVVGKLTLVRNASTQVNGDIRFTNLDLRTLMRSLGSASQLGQGKATGKLTLAGRNVRSINDLTGDLTATVHGVQAMSFPILGAVQPYLTAGLSSSTTFDRGELRARLASGVVRLERLSLRSSAAQVYADGSVSLAGRLALNVVANTGQTGGLAGGLLLARLPLFGATPVGLLLRANQFLANRVIYAEVTGTVRGPVIRIKPAPLLADEAVRFLLGMP